MNDRSNNKRTFKTNSIADIADKINNRVFRKFGFAKSDIIHHWSGIVGPVLARSSVPERLVQPREHERETRSAGTLHIRIEGSFAPEMQHLEPLVIDRINSYYGFNAVEKLIFHHGIVTQDPIPRKYEPPILSDSQKNELELRLKDIKDEKLRASLYKVGTEIIGQEKPREVKNTKRFTRRGRGSLHDNDKKQG